jgi:short-subunit dehydrogenase
MDNYDNKYIWIIGASSGIGKALAENLAKQGANLALSARSKSDLETLKKELDDDAPTREHLIHPLDVGDLPSLNQAAEAINSTWPRVDSIIHLAAIYAPSSFVKMDIDAAHKLININFAGTLNVIHIALPLLKGGTMLRDEKSQLVICGSVAGYCGLPNGQPYSASKAAIINLVESLRAEETDLDIKLISPGFVRTPLTDKNPFPMPFIIEPEDAAERIVTGLLTSKYEIHFPRRLTWLMKILKRLPAPLFFAITKQMVK